MCVDGAGLPPPGGCGEMVEASPNFFGFCGFVFRIGVGGINSLTSRTDVQYKGKRWEGTMQEVVCVCGVLIGFFAVYFFFEWLR